MNRLSLARPGDRMSVLCIGAHADDIEIGAGATLLGWIAKGVRLDVHWLVLSATGGRAGEARSSAGDFTQGAACNLELAAFRDGFFPQQGAELKHCFENLKARINPDVIFTHSHDDAHQDHREVARLTRSTFRDHLTLEYEVPKWDGDLGRPALFVPVTAAVLERKIALLLKNFESQRGKGWFDAETFRGLARLRGVECRAPERYAEAFHVQKITIA